MAALTLAEIQSFINFVNGNIGKKVFTDENPSGVDSGKKLLTTGVGLGVDFVDDISYQLGIIGNWDVGNTLPPDLRVGQRYIVTTAGTYNGVSAQVGDLVEFITLTSIFVYPTSSSIVSAGSLANYATKTYAQGLVTGLLDDRGSYNPTLTSAYPTIANNGSGLAGAIMKGDIWFISTDGIMGTNNVLAGYSVRALVDEPGQIDTNWDILNVGLGYVAENVVNKKTSLNGALDDPNDIDYPSTQVVDDALDLKANILDETHTGAMRLPSSLKIYDPTAITREVAVDVGSLTAGLPRTVTFPDRNIVLGDLPVFAASTKYKQYAFIQHDGLLYSAKIDFTSGTSFNVSDWDSVGGSGALVAQVTGNQDIVTGYEYFMVPTTNNAITLETPDPSLVPDGSKIIIHNLGYTGAITLGKTNWTTIIIGNGFAVAPSFATVSTASIPSYSTGATTVLTSRQASAVWVKETTYGSTIPVGTTVGDGKAYFAREDDVTATVSFDLGNIPASTNKIVTFPNADIDLGKVPTTFAYSPATTDLTVTNTDATTFTTNLAPISTYTIGVVYSVGALVHHQEHTWKVIVAHTCATPFVNGNLELVGDTFRIYTTSTSYTCQRLGTGNVGNGVRTDKRLALDLGNINSPVVDISEAPSRITIRNTNRNSGILTLTKTSTSIVNFYDQEDNIITISPAGTTSTYAIRLGGYDEIEILNSGTVAHILNLKQNVIGRFKIRDVSSLSGGDYSDGWLFTGATNTSRTITLPNNDVDLGKVAQAASVSVDGYLAATDFVKFNKLGSLITISANNATSTLLPNSTYSVKTTLSITAHTFVLPANPTNGMVVELNDTYNTLGGIATLKFRSDVNFSFPHGSTSQTISGTTPNIEWTDNKRATNKSWRFTYINTGWIVEEITLPGFRSTHLERLQNPTLTPNDPKFVDFSIPVLTVNRTITIPDNDVDLGLIGPATKVYTSGVAYAVGELVHHQNHTWRVLVAHTGAIPFVNGNLELVGDVFQLFQPSTPYVAQRLGVKSPALNMVDKTLDVTFYVNGASTIDISEAPARVTVRNGIANGARAITITKTHATNSVVFVDDTAANINTTSGLTATYVITLGAGQEVELLNLSYNVVVKLRKQNTIGRFKLCDNSSTLDADKNDGWLFTGTATAPRTITLPDADVNLSGLQGAIDDAAVNFATPTVNSQSGTSYTLGTVATDNNGKTYLRMTSASANTVTIPSTQTKPISIRQAGTGTTTLIADTGVTPNGTLAFIEQHQTKTVIPLGSGIYDVVG